MIRDIIQTIFTRSGRTTDEGLLGTLKLISDSLIIAAICLSLMVTEPLIVLVIAIGLGSFIALFLKLTGSRIETSGKRTNSAPEEIYRSVTRQHSRLSRS